MTDMTGKAIDPGPPRAWHQKRRFTMPIAALIGFMMGVGGQPEPEIREVAAPQEVVTEVVTERVTEEVTVEPEPEPEEDVELPEDLEEQIGLLAMENAWREQDSTTQAQLCLSWNLDPQMALDAFDQGTEGVVSESLARTFFDEKCA